MNISEHFSNIESSGALPQIIATVLIFVLWSLSWHISRKLITKYGKLRNKSMARIYQAKHIISILLNVLFVFMIIIVWGVEPKNLLLGMSSVFAFLGVALFAQWSVLSNITAGIIMYFSAPYHVGDRIRILDKDIAIEAVIEEIQAFYIYIRTDDNELITLPNNLFMQKIVSVKKNSEGVD